MIKSLIATLVLAFSLLGAKADSFTYTYVPNRLPPIPHSTKPRVYPSGHFTVQGDAVRLGFAMASDVIELSFRYPSPASYGYSAFDFVDGQSFEFDPATAEFVGGGLHATCAWSTYGHGALFTPLGVIQDNPIGGNTYGHWIASYNP